MSAHDLTPAEIAALVGPDNHPNPLTADELERLIAPLSDAQVEEVVEHLGLGPLARQLPRAFVSLMRAAKHVASARPPEYDDEVDNIIRNFDVVGFAQDLDVHTESVTPPPSSPELPTTPPPIRTSQSTPCTPARSGNRTYIVDSPAKVGRTISWLEAGSLTLGVVGASVHGVGGRRPRHRKSHAWVVFYGGQVGAFKVYADVQRSITGNGVAIHGGFHNFEAAMAALEYARGKGWTGDSSPPPASTSASASSDPYADNPLNSGSSNDVWYVVCRGVEPGVYRSYLECSLNITGVKGNLFSSFATREEAEWAFASALKMSWVRSIARQPRSSMPSSSRRT
ncbi:hypothetical protein DFH06DRAFT_1129606 [Mycena polygramma]|nr:hypothetical protein DFH06DRAFT_1129606 [Mycena polygramma]